MSRTTTALVLTKINGPFEVQQVHLGSIQPEEVLVEIHASGICHTDLSCASGILPCEAHAVLGHEGAGIVLEAGSDVKSVRKGDKVLLSFSHCESCVPCTSGHPAYCYDFNLRNFGGRRPDGSSAMRQKEGGTPIFSSFFGQSSFARHTLVHRSSVVKVPQETRLDLFAPLGCGIQTGAGAVLNTLNIQPGGTLAVFGVGSVGLSAVLAAKLRNAKTIIAVDLQTSRLELAKRLGATHAIRGSGGDVVQQIRGICPPVGVDYAVDCTGIPLVIKTMIDALGTRGRAATVGAPGAGADVMVDVMNHLTYGKEYVGCCEGDSVPSKFIPFLIKMHEQGEFPIEEFITYYDISDHTKAVEDSTAGKTIKAVLKWGNP